MTSTSSSDFVYVQARLLARHGMRAGDADWRRIDATLDVTQLLHAVRATGLRHWVERIGHDSSCHFIEQQLRVEWRRCVHDVARWLPREWQSSVQWLAVLVDVPAVAHWAHGEPMPAGLHADPRYEILFAPDSSVPATRADGVRQLVTRLRPERFVLDAWSSEWWRRVPPCSAETLESLGNLRNLVIAHRAAMLAASAGSGWKLREALARKASHLIRLHAESPVALCAHLLLTALDLERLRGALVQRVVRAEAPAARA
jgi:hypothetical protein